MFRQLGLEVAKLLLVRKLAIEEQVGDFLVLRLAGQLLYPVAAVLEEVVGDRADRRGRRDHALEPARCRFLPVNGHGPSLAQRPRKGRGSSRARGPMVMISGTCDPKFPEVQSRWSGQVGLNRSGEDETKGDLRALRVTRALKLLAPHPTHQRRAAAIKAGALSLSFHPLEFCL